MPDIFVRETRLSEIVERLELNQWCAVVAPPLSGKTTLARQLTERLKQAHPQWRVVCVRFKQARTLQHAWTQLLQQAGVPDASVGEQPSNCRDPSGTRSRSTRRTGVAESLAGLVADRSATCCLVLDELERLPDEVLRLLALELRRFRNSARFSAQHSRVHCVLFGGTKLLYLTSKPFSPLANIIETMPLPDLSKEEAAVAFSSVLAGVPLNGELQSALFAETAGHPYLVAEIAAAFSRRPSDLSVEMIEKIGTDYAVAWAEDDTKADLCFRRAIRWLSRDRRAFETVLALLAGSCDRRPVQGLDDMVTMCGAVTVRDGCFAFRGRIFERAFSRYMDDLRKADYWCLHGNWEQARGCYERVPAAEIVKHRKTDGNPTRRIMDLYLGITPDVSRRRRLPQAEQLVAETARGFFGADRVRLWRVKLEEETAQCVADAPDSKKLETGRIPSARKKAAAAAARRNSPYTRADNIGIIQSIGDDHEEERWALELYYRQGLPGPWVSRALQYAKTTLHMVLDHGRRYEERIQRQKEQRVLIHDISLKLQRATQLDEVFTHIVDGFKNRLGYECAQLSLVFPTERKIRAVRCNGAFVSIKDDTVREVDGDDILALVVRSHQRMIVPDCRDPKYQCEQQAARKSGMKSLVVVPLFDGDEAVGVLQIGDTERYNAFDDTDADLAELFADAAAVAIRVTREREARQLLAQAVGHATAIVDTTGHITGCDPTYRAFFGVQTGSPSSIQLKSGSPSKVPLARIAFDRQRPFSTVREKDGRNYIATVVALKDVFGGYAGGAEIVDTKSPLYGLTQALTEMLKMSSSRDLGQAMVDCLCNYLGYTRARFYELDPEGLRLISQCSHGLDENRNREFALGHVKLTRSLSGTPVDGFECLRLDGPLVMIRQEHSAETLPLREITHDSQGRRVMVLAEKDVLFINELDKHESHEWLDVPLGTAHVPLGKLSVDLKGSDRVLGLDDIELLGLFGRWASAVLASVLQLEKARRRADLAPGLRMLGDSRNLLAIAWTFLLNITIEGGPGFNRAVLFLKRAQSKTIHGLVCHGAPDRAKWLQELDTLETLGNRRDFIAGTIKRKLTEGSPEEEEARFARLRNIAILEGDPGHPFSQAIASKHAKLVDRAQDALREFYEMLQWQPAASALICPLLYDEECEGLVYVDRTYSTDQAISNDDYQTIESLALHLAAVVRPLRLAEQLRSQVLAVSHTTLTPVAAVYQLADGIKKGCADLAIARGLELIIAEAARAADTIRRIMWHARLQSETYCASPTAVDLAHLVAERIAPYQRLMAEDNVKVEILLLDAPAWADLDDRAVGDVFAELASNAMMAIRSTFGSAPPRIFRVACGWNAEQTEIRVTFENSGPVIRAGDRESVFEPFVSGMGSTGLGLWLARRIVAANRGQIWYDVTVDGLSRFTIAFPCHRFIGGL